MARVSELVTRIVSRHTWVVAVLAGLATMCVAMYMSVGQSVWFDEGYSIMLAQRPVHEIVALTAVDAHPPLYYLYLKLWGSVFGWSEFWLRMSSVVAGSASVGVMIVILRRLFTARVAIACAPFLVLAPFLARYNFEIRMYALVGLIGVVATWVLLKAQESGSWKWWLVYSLLVTASMYTLYMSVVFWFAHVLWLIYTDFKHKRPVIPQKHWLYYLLSVVLFLPWVQTLQHQLDNSALPPYMTAVTFTELTNLTGMLLGYNAFWQIGPWLAIALLIVLVLMFRLITSIWREASPRYRPGLVLLILSFFTGLVFFALISLPPQPPRFMERYTVHIALFFYALVAVSSVLGWRIGRRWQAGLLAVTSIVVMVNGLGILHGLGNFNFQRVQQPSAKVIRSSIGCDDTTYVTAGPYGYIDMWYDFQGCDMRFYEPTDLTFSGGFAPVTNSKDRIKDTSGLTAKRIAFVYYDDSEEFMTPDSRYHQVGQRDFGKTYITLYEQ